MSTSALEDSGRSLNTCDGVSEIPIADDEMAFNRLRRSGNFAQSELASSVISLTNEEMRMYQRIVVRNS